MSSRYRLVMAALCAALAGCGAGTAIPDLVFAPDALPDAVVGQVYSGAIVVSANETPVGLIEVGQGSLPPGLVLVHRPIESTASLEGTPELPGTFAFSIRASCFGTNRPGQVGAKAYSIAVLPAAQGSAGK